MKIYSKKLTWQDLAEAARPVPGVYLEDATLIDTRNGPRRFERVAIRAARETGHRPNSGKYGASSGRSATWDEHGWWMAELFRRDPDARIIGSVRYEGAGDFRAKTAGKYELIEEKA
jgi:hypothetical protein